MVGRHKTGAHEVDESGTRARVELDTTSAIQKRSRSYDERALASALDDLDPDSAVAMFGAFDGDASHLDRPTPVELPKAALVDATAAGPGSSALPITLPPAPAVEVSRPADEAAPPDTTASASNRAATPDPRILKTRLARKITTLADEVNECFADFRIGVAEWRVELTAPEGMSTGGGKQALQNLRLLPREPSFPTFVIGVVDPIEKTSELRAYAHMSALHEMRYARAPEVTPEEWAKVLENCEVVLKLANIASARVSTPPDVLAARRANGSRRLLPIAIAVAALVAAALAAWRLLLLS